MNVRILKKLSKKAAAILQQREGIDCSPSDPGESCEFRRAGWPRHQFRYGKRADRNWDWVDLLPGTPLYSWRCSFEYDEWDYRPAWNELLERVSWEYATYGKDVDPNYEPAADNGDAYPVKHPDLGTPAKLFALLKTDPPKPQRVNI